jgi:acetyltransferase-like isoleucine patch superfamily enzyme
MTLRNHLRAVLRQLVSFAGSGPPFTSHPERVTGLDRVYSIHPTARLAVADASFSQSRIVLGRGVYVGRHVELTAAQGGSIDIGDDTSIQHECLISGDVRIGAHCLFGKYIFIGSTHHRFSDKPSWLIRDQDVYIPAHPDEASDALSDVVRIEDDCWLGQGVVIRPGVYVGRGAVIGANTVVTSDIGPYEIHGGVPNRKIGARLDFAPPQRIDAEDDNAIPYFYRGFRLAQSDLARSRRAGVVEAWRHACLILAPAAGQLRLSGRRFSAADLRLRLRINGAGCGEHEITSETFELSIDVPRSAEDDAVPLALRRYTVVEIEALSISGDRSFGVSFAALVPALCAHQ